MKTLFPYVSSFFRQRVMALFHHADPLEASTDERRQRWSEVIAEHQQPLEPQKDSGRTTLPQP